MKSIARLAFVVLMAAAIMHFSSVVARAAAGTVKVTIDYKGKGTVDSAHRVFVWLFNSPDIGAGSIPIAERTIDTNGNTAVFDGVVEDRVWIAVAYDENGVMTGNAPPPPGTPVALYVGSDGVPRAVEPVSATVAVLTFDDSIRMP